MKCPECKSVIEWIECPANPERVLKVGDSFTCVECHALPSVELGKKIQRIREAIEKAREAAANG